MKRYALIFVASGWAIVGSAAAPAAGEEAQGGATEAVLLIDVVDVSGTMAGAIAAMVEAEVDQLQRSLRPEDLYARVNFDGTARTTVLQKMSEAEDVERLARLLARPEAAGAKTSISSGLIEARQIVEREAAPDQHVVFVLATDAISDPPDGPAAEAARMTDAAAWWRNRSQTERIVVGVQTATNQGQLQRLAKDLGATLVTIEEYRAQPLVERAIVDARALPPPAPSTVPGPQSSPWWPWLVGAVVAVLGVAVAFRDRKRAPQGGPPAPVIAASARQKPAPRELVVLVTAHGNTQRHVIPVDDEVLEIATLGMAGTVFVPGLPGRPVTVLATSDGIRLVAEPSTGIRVDGESLLTSTSEVSAGRRVRISHHAVTVTLELRVPGQLGAITLKPAPRIKVSARRTG
jgi:hypothetical protein